MKTRQSPGILLAAALAVALPVRVGAQQAAFVQAVSELTAAIEGTYGDEGALVRPAIDRMSAALTQWDREIEAAAAVVRDASLTPASGLVDSRISLGRMYANRGRLGDALSQLDAASRLEPRRAEIHVLRGLVLEASGKPAEAIAAFRVASAMAPGNPVISYYLFHEAAISGRPDDAREAAAALAATYTQILKAKPRKKGTPFTRIALFQAAAGGPPVLPPAAYRQAYDMLARGEYEHAIAEFRKAAAGDSLVADPAAGSEWMMRAVVALREGRLTDARSLLEQSGPPRDSSEAHRVLGLVYRAESEFDRSIASLTTAISLSPRDERARLALARVLNAAGRDADAERALHETVRVLPDSALAHWWLTLSYDRANRFAEARQEVEQVTAAAISGESQLYAVIGRFAMGAADGPGALNAIGRAVRADPNDPAMHKFLAGALMQQDHVDEAFAEFVAALLIDPQDAEAHAGIGRIHLNASRDADAVEAFRRAVNISPANSEMRYALASALVRVGRTQEAAQHFERVEQAQRQSLADRRRSLSFDVLKEEAALRAAEGRFDIAITLYEKALGVSSDAAVYGQLADLYAKAGRAQDAARARAMYEMALQSSQAGSAR